VIPDELANVVQQVIEAITTHCDKIHSENQEAIAAITRRLDAVEMRCAPGPKPTRQYMRVSRMRSAPP
jgi:hypothetical protein